MKKRKLLLKDRILQLENCWCPDIPGLNSRPWPDRSGPR